MGNFCLGGTDSLLWPLQAPQGGDDQDLRSFCFRPQGFAPSHNASSGQKVCCVFAIEFRTLATTCKWNESGLVARFLEGLNVDLKEEIYERGPPAQLDQLIELGIRLEQWRRVWVSNSRPLETLTPAVVSSTLRSDPELSWGLASLQRNDNGGFWTASVFTAVRLDILLLRAC